jgi:hypothetical protein
MAFSLRPMPAPDSRIAWVQSRKGVGASLFLLVFLACGNGTIDLFPPQRDQPTDAARQDQVTDDVATSSQNEDGPNVGCRSDADCTSSDAPRCESALHVCVQCVGLAGDCPNPPESKCNRVTNKCVLPCATSGDCSSPDVCDGSQGACAECLDDLQCAKSDEPRCVEEQCVQCQGAQDCSPGAHCWQATCVACVTDADCPEGGTCSTDHACN